MENLLKEVISEIDKKMDKSLKVVGNELARIRTGKAAPSLVEDITVDAYGQRMPVKQVASIAAPDPHSIVIQPWDKGVADAVVRAILQADLGLNPSFDGNVIRVAIPPLSDERRAELVKVIHKIAEDGRIAIRSIRHDGIDKLKKMEKDKEITEDIRRRGEKDIQKLTDNHIKKIDELAVSKEKVILGD